ncbi:hypothetical protein HAX54_014652 [Datura stramonium]|uniref:NB-ARC domain-containing protein n=2 Tax=Datura stramonium TaxID=4076 RepID=A0ABS8TND9_DATST|nr:hypothetical protein [Datura stramonium]
MMEVANIDENKVADLELYNTTDVVSAHTSQFAQITSMREEMVGFDEVVKILRQHLIGGSSALDLISIVGMAGLGKTTLANKLFLDQLVVSHFDVRAQCCVSQVYTRKDLLLTILRDVKKDAVISDKLPENELADKLRKLLLVKRYLILIDDVWETIAWDDLKPCFYDANNRSRIILTTQLGDVASHAKLISDPYLRRLFTPDESWMLLMNKVFHKKSCPPVLEDVGKKIAQKCGGLPLSVVLVAGILKTMEKEKHCWEQFSTNLGPHIQAKSEDIINLSYRDLPFHLKPCFLYFGIFLEDEEIQVSKLTWLWTAEGLVKTHTEMLSEDIAEHYLKNLIGRNLVMVSKKSSDGKTKTCRIHDLLHEFCKRKAKVENFLQCIKGDSDNMNPSSISYQKHSIPRRLCLYLQGDNLAEWSSICSDLQCFHSMKGRQIGLSSIGHASHTFNSFKFLWVLHLESTVIDSFPEALTCLRYVAVRVAEDSSLSFSTNLWNLQTLIVKGLGGRVTLPDTLWKMSWSSRNPPQFVVLKLLQVTIYSKVWEVTDEQFLHLKFLKLQDPSFSEWNVSDDAFPCLEHLVLRKVRHIKKIPSHFEDMPTLKSIEVILVSKPSLLGAAVTVVEPSSTPAGDKEIRETFNRIDEGIERIEVGLERMMVLLEKMAKREELKIVAAVKSQSNFDHKEEMESSKVSCPTSGHKNITLIYSSSVNSNQPLFTFTTPRSPETKTFPATILDHPHFGYHGKVKSAWPCNGSCWLCLFISNRALMVGS